MNAVYLQEKHTHLQALASLITMMVDSCPNSPHEAPTQPLRTSQEPDAGSPHWNNIVRLFVKERILQDLACVPHSIDLSSAQAVSTINAVLKPLEDLTRIINSPA